MLHCAMYTSDQIVKSFVEAPFILPWPSAEFRCFILAAILPQVEEAMTIFQDMVARGCERNVITYSSLITACEKSGRYQLALDFFNEMHRDNVKPNVVTYNALIAACGQGEYTC